MTDKKPREKPLHIDIDFDEALERFASVDLEEMPSKDVVPHIHNGAVVNQRSTDGYMNATLMCKASGKEWSNYRQNAQTEAFLLALERSLGIPRDRLIQSIATGPNDQRGTWVHPQVAINLAAWLSPKFAVQVSEWVVTWMMEISRRQSEYPDFAALTEDEQRLYLRDQVTASQKTLAAAAHAVGVITPKDHSIFNSNGYRGMYDGRGVKEIQKHKGLTGKQKILDHMGSAELAANLFRITQTEEKLSKDGIDNKFSAFDAHYEIGLRVRQAMIDMSGVPPEDLPTAPDVKKLQRQRSKGAIAASIEMAQLPPQKTGIMHEVDLGGDLWKYALLIMVQKPRMFISTTDLIAELPNYIAIPDGTEKTNSSRKDSKFSQIIRNLKSHKTSKTNFIYQGYAEAEKNGFRATQKGLDFVRDYFKDRLG